MAYEIRATDIPGQSLTVQLMLGTTLVGVPIPLVETAIPGVYMASVPSDTAPGNYDMALIKDGTARDVGGLRWDGTQELPDPPSAPSDVGLCRVYGYLETISGGFAACAEVFFYLVSSNPDTPIVSERVIVGRSVRACSDALGRLAGPTGDPWIDLQRNDLLQTTSGDTHYLISSPALGVFDKKIVLASDTADLRDLLMS